MSETAITDSLVDHFKRTWGMLREGIANFPEETRLEGEEPRMGPARIGYHILLSAERYTWEGAPDDYVPNRQFKLDWETTPPVPLQPVAASRTITAAAAAIHCVFISHSFRAI